MYISSFDYSNFVISKINHSKKIFHFYLFEWNIVNNKKKNKNFFFLSFIENQIVLILFYG